MERTEVTSSLATKQVLTQLASRFGLVGESPLMMQAILRLLQVAPTDLTVLITGETGTGKEVFAHAVHELSQRKKAPFVGVNCAAIPETLLESELFGAEKGAYTGSVEQRKGFFETAHKGTIFLDEIGEMPIGTQVKLLRILESGEFSRLGSSGNLKVDVRVVAATNKDLAYEVRQGRFRQDLYFRLNSVNIVLPPLRQHPDDIPLLVEHFAHKVAEKNHITYQGIDADAAAVLEAMPWQGNVRELRNIVETMVTLEQGSRISSGMIQRYLPQQQTFEEPRSTQAIVRVVDQASTVHDPDAQMIYRLLLQLTNDVNDMKTVLRHLVAMGMESVTPSSTAIMRAPQDQPVAPVELNLAAMERGAIEEALRRSKGNRREAADMLGISERTLYRKITEYQLD
ncbi:sigma-54-dependent Fis family transcriptional regulator [soil metagenome]